MRPGTSSTRHVEVFAPLICFFWQPQLDLEVRKVDGEGRVHRQFCLKSGSAHWVLFKRQDQHHRAREATLQPVRGILGEGTLNVN